MLGVMLANHQQIAVARMQTKSGGGVIIPGTLPTYFSMSFYSGVSRGWHRALHMFVVLCGITTGYAYVIGNIMQRANRDVLVTNSIAEDTTVVIQIVLIVISAFCVVLFLLATLIDTGYLPPTWKRRMLFIEFLGLFYYIMSLVFTASVSGAFSQSQNRRR